MVGSSFVSEDEVRRYLEAAFQEYLGLLGTRYDELLLRSNLVTAFAGEDTIQLGAQAPRNPAGWTFSQTTQGSQALVRPDGTATCITSLHTHTDGMVVIPLTNMAYVGEAPVVTVELELAMGQGTPSDQFLYIEVGAPDSVSLVSDSAYQAWINLDTLAAGTVGASVNISGTELSTATAFRDQWRKVTLTFQPPGPRLGLRLTYVAADGSSSANTTDTLLIGNVKVLQAAPIKKLRAVRIESSYFLRRGQIRELESYSQAGNLERYILRADNGREEMPQLMLMPTPSVNTQLRYYFVPVFTLDDVGMMSLMASWDEYVVIKAAIKMKDKEESDVSVLMAELEQLSKRLLEDLEPIDASEPAQVQRFGGATQDPYSGLCVEEVF